MLAGSSQTFQLPPQTHPNHVDDIGQCPGDPSPPQAALKAILFRDHFRGSGVIVAEKDIRPRNASGGRPMQSITRRRLIAATAGIAAAALAPRIVVAQAPAPPPPAGPFKRDPLPYPTNALEPH